MFGGKTIKFLQEEINYLRGLVSSLELRNKELTDQIVAMKNLPAFESVQMNKDEPESSQGVDLLGVVQDMEPRNPEEVEQKKLAEMQIQGILGNAVTMEI